MESYAQVPFIRNGVVFSDPSYDGSVWCQYRKDFTADNWLMKLESKSENDFISFALTLGRTTVLSDVNITQEKDNIEIRFPGRFEAESIQLGMDTASMFFGLQDHWDNHRQEASMRTGTDGYFGDLTVFTCKGEAAPAGFVITGGLEANFMDEKGLFQHLLSSFDALEISREQFASRTDPNCLEVRLLATSEIRHAMESKQSKAPGIQKENER